MLVHFYAEKMLFMRYCLREAVKSIQGNETNFTSVPVERETYIFKAVCIEKIDPSNSHPPPCLHLIRQLLPPQEKSGREHLSFAIDDHVQGHMIFPRMFGK